jgi:hypothetical protein
MAFTLDNIIQQATGTFTGNSGSVSLPAGTTAGSSVLIVGAVAGDNTNSRGFQTPSGFVAGPGAQGFQGYGFVKVYMKSSASADETSWTLTQGFSNTGLVIWMVFEIVGVDTGPWDFEGNTTYVRNYVSGSVSTAASYGTGNAVVSETFEGISLAMFLMTSTDTTPPTITGYDNGFFEFVTRSEADSPKALTLGVAAKAQNVVGVPNCTASVSPNSYGTQAFVVLTGVESRHAPNLQAIFGAEVGTATGLAAAVDGPAPFDAVTGSPEIVTTHARSGSYALKLSSTSAAENGRWIRQDLPRGTLGTTTDNPVTMWTKRYHFYFEDLPAADTELLFVEAGSHANGVVFWYRTASQKIGCKIGTGTEVLSDAVIAADQYIGLDMEYDPRTTTHTCRWAVDYNAEVGDATASVTQTTASTSSMTAAAVTTVGLGWTNAVTATMWIDDVVGTRHRKAYPIDEVRVLPLKVDPAGTPSVVGTSTNFRTFTNNGTLATWTAAGTRNALDDVPPTIGASSDGLTQTAVSITDYVHIPMETFTAAPDYSLMGGRWYWAGWAVSGNPGNIQFEPDDGVTEFNPVGSATDTGFDDSTLIWCTYIHNPSETQNSAYLLTQAKLDALAARVGFSADANPDVGIHCILFELVVQPPLTFSSAEAEDGIFRVYTRQSRGGAVVSYVVTTPPSRGATVYGTIGGSDWSQHVDADDVWVKSVGADDITGVTAGPGLTPDQ